MNITQKPAIIAVAVLGLFLMTKKASAQTRTAAASTPQAAAMRYSITPGTALAGGAGNVTSGGNNTSAVMSLATAALNALSPNRTVDGPWGEYFPARLGTSPSAEADGTIGEGAAQAFYNANPASFAAPDPTITDSMTQAALLEGMSEY